MYVFPAVSVGALMAVPEKTRQIFTTIRLGFVNGTLVEVVLTGLVLAFPWSSFTNDQALHNEDVHRIRIVGRAFTGRIQYPIPRISPWLRFSVESRKCHWL